jgi:ADP-heptose:LPS heptosyltransferase
MLPLGMRLETLGSDFDAGADAFVDTAAVMQHLDLVISVDTSVAHLAGALGRPAWVALKRVPDWRWLMGRGDSPWYPTLRLFRQKVADDWRGVIEDMAGELRKLAGEWSESLEAPPPAAAGGAFSDAHIRRNDPCPCGSGKRFKHCHGAVPA